MGLYPDLNTHRNREALKAITGASAASLFQYECAIAGISAFFSRYTVKARKDEPMPQRIFFATIMSFLSYNRKPYEIICAFHLFSYISPLLISWYHKRQGMKKKEMSIVDKLRALTVVAISGVASLLFCQYVASGDVQRILSIITPKMFVDAIYYLFPVAELQESHDIVSAFVKPVLLQRMLSHLLFVTFHVQIGIGYLGIDFLTNEQLRKNQLIRMEFNQADAEKEQQQQVKGDSNKADGNSSPASSTPNSPPKKITHTKNQLDAAGKFRRAAVPFIFFTVIPYMIQIIFFGNMNQFAFFCVRDDIHREIRLNGLFEHDSHLVAMASSSATSPEQYAASMDTVVSTSYDVFNRKIFSLPKIMLLPGVIVKQPSLLIKIFPFIFLSDFIKARLVATVTNEVERLQKEAKEIQSIRSKVEAFDMKNAELLQRAGFGATEFTRVRWEELTEAIQTKEVASEQLRRTRMYFQWLQNNFVFKALIDCALANLIAMGRIVSAEIFVFSRAIEDSVDLLLMRSRAEAELATMSTEVAKLRELSSVWERGQKRNLVHCNFHDEISNEHGSNSVVIHNLQYSRGTAFVSIENLELTPGVYAVTGANGSGKSTLFRVLMSCDTNDKSIDLPESIQLYDPIHHHSLMDEVVPPESCKVPDEGCEVLPVEDEKDQHNQQGVVEIPVTSITMPSSHISEISQTFYWPLYTKPIDWIYQKHLSDEMSDRAELESMVRVVAEHLQSLAFLQTQISSDDASDNGAAVEDTTCKYGTCEDVDASTAQLIVDLQEEKEDWFGDLSGGQKSKVELVRKVFLHEKCPDVLLIDETMAPLDPTSKSLVMSKVKDFCKNSVVLVIYHTDVGRGENGDGDGDDSKDDDFVECVPSNNFFDHNLHVENKVLVRRSVC